VICQLFFQKKLAAFLPDLRGRGILPPFDEKFPLENEPADPSDDDIEEMLTDSDVPF